MGFIMHKLLLQLLVASSAKAEKSKWHLHPLPLLLIQTFPCQYMTIVVASVPIGAWMCNFPPFRIIWQTNAIDRPTNQLTTDQPTEGQTGSKISYTSNNFHPTIHNLPIISTFLSYPYPSFHTSELTPSPSLSPRWWWNLISACSFLQEVEREEKIY